ncbi:glutamate receptor 2.8 isoform X2 [Rosa chinensis]|uniref:glutamate receptor 2.8 isoform X2 n=1 Tax=Rosa chinensis TaxID=74649 RepID=UPI001AD938AE|nr:glutamate receptor 2.8 isoform X2 [Rosa chinensis]
MVAVPDKRFTYIYTRAFKFLCHLQKSQNMINKAKYPSSLENKLALSFMFFLFLSSSITLAMPQSKTIIPVNVGVVLDDHIHSRAQKIWLSCIKMALFDFYASNAHYKSRVVLKVRDSKRNVVHAAAAALDLIKNEKVRAIIGPVTTMETSFVINLGNEAHVPIISFSSTSPSLTSIRSSYFFQFAQNDSIQVEVISSIVKAFGWRQVVPIYIDTAYGEAIIPYLTDALDEVGARVPYRSVISPSATDDQIEKELYKLMTMQTRVFLVHMTTSLCSRVLYKAKAIGMMSEGYVWIMTSGITNRLRMTDDFSFLNSLDGILGVQTYVPKTKELHQEFIPRWHLQFLKDTPANSFSANLDVFALWAYDAAHALAIAIEEVTWSTSNIDFQKSHTAPNNSTDLESLAVSQYGPKLCKALSTTRFNGIAGDFRLVDRQLQSSTFQIVNINGGATRTIGFWTPENGLCKKLGSSVNTGKGSISNGNLGPIIWPGDSLSVPKGWEIPTNGKKLRIAVPQKVGFTEFVKITKDPSTNITDVSGFSIDVFEAALEILPYALPYEFIPFAKPDGTTAGNNNDLCYQVSIGNFDAIVGDTTITANRSLFVDFTMPYTEAGIVMVVPVRDSNRKSAWAFLKPWRWDLWFTTACFFLFIGFVVWVLEHRINKHFRGPPSHQVGTSIWFSFSTMVFAQTARVVSNWARVVMIIWIFVLLVLTINYTASLTSLYTVQKLQPTVTDIKDLLKKGEKVGHVRNYVRDMLKQKGFDDSKLKRFTTVEEIDDALSKGSANGGVAGVIDETPNLKLFLAKYCNKYTMAFPKGSPFLQDVSQAVLNVTGGDKIMKIENKWFKKESSCQDLTNPNINSNGLGVDSFWVLFLIVAGASILALIIFVVSFIYRHKVIWSSEASIWCRIQKMLTIFNEKDLSYHTFNINEKEDEVTHALPNSSPESSVHQNLNQGNSNSVFSGSGEQQAARVSMSSCCNS